MQIALLSDSHNNWNALQTAATSSAAADCDVALFAGDLTRPKGVGVLAEFPGPVHTIIGNMDSQIDAIWAAAEETENVIYHGEMCDIERSGVRIFMHHHPELTEDKASGGVYDLCVHGHLHEFRESSVGETKLINPGALTRRSSSPEWAVFGTETNKVARWQT
jgi:putative phosphoesterase